MRHVSHLRGIADPFGERPGRSLRIQRQLLGGRFGFRSNSPSLLRLADVAYRGLPAHRLSDSTPRFDLRLELVKDRRAVRGREPPDLTMHSGAGVLCGTMTEANFAIVAPERRSGLVVISDNMLRHFPYHVRYELIEFAVFTLAARSQGLVPLHAACIGENDRAALLIGSSGAGKSTLVLHGALHGMNVVAEDSTFVAPGSLLATGIGTFLHVRTDAPRIGGVCDDWIRSSPVIRRRSGIRKFEIDLRDSSCRMAPRPPEIAALVFVSKRRVARGPLLQPLGRAEALRRLAMSQAYAVGQPGWNRFSERVRRVPAFELRRGADPRAGVEVLRAMLDR